MPGSPGEALCLGPFTCVHPRPRPGPAPAPVCVRAHMHALDAELGQCVLRPAGLSACRRVGRGGSVWPPRPGLWACHSLRAAEDADVHPTHFQLDDFCSCRKVSRNVPELTVFRTRSLACLCPPGVVGCVYLLSDSSTVWLSRWSLPSVQASHLRQGGASP